MNHLIIKIESGVVADIYVTEPVNVTIVDHDVIEGGETFESRLKKAVLSMTPDQRIRPDEIEQVVKRLVLECRRPADRRLPGRIMIDGEAAA
jgi:predicted metal-dependent phosphoesterase TrpH